MRRRANVAHRLCAVGASLALTFGLSACGDVAEPAGTATAIVPQAANDGPGQDGAGGDDGNAVATQTLDQVVHGASASQQACMTRNGAVVPWVGSNVMQTTHWYEDHRQSAHRLIIAAVWQRLGVYSTFGGPRRQEDDVVMSGLLGYALDPVGSRLILQLDPTIVDAPKFRKWITKVAHTANAGADVRGRPLTVTVQNGCFSAREIHAAKKYVEENPRLQLSYMESSVRLDGRLHMGFADQSSIDEVQRHLGPVVATEQRPIGRGD